MSRDAAHAGQNSDQIENSIQRVALIFGSSEDCQAIGLRCRRALGQLVEVEQYLREELDGIPCAGYDLILHVSDGRDCDFVLSQRPVVVWYVDPIVELESIPKSAEAADFVFVSQQSDVERLRQQGIAAFWLPLACDPELDGPAEERSNCYDVTIVGNWGADEAAFVDSLRSRDSRLSVISCRAEMASRYIFETMCRGSLLITRDVGEQERMLFDDGDQLVTFKHKQELLEKVDWYLRCEEEWRKVVARGRSAVLARHSYWHRMTRLLRIAERNQRGESIESEVANSPGNWFVEPRLPSKSVSACLVSWKRPDNVREIVSRLRAEPLIDDIVVWNNDPSTQLGLDDIPDVTVVSSDCNLVTYGRYLCAARARHDVVYTQDDDCLVHNIAELAETWRLDPSRIAHNLKLTHLAANSESLFGDAHMALVGWGAVFDRTLLQVFDGYRQAFGEDELLRRKADRLFSLLQGRRHRSIPANITDLAGASGSEALSVRHDHMELTRQAIERALRLLHEQNANGKKPTRSVAEAQSGHGESVAISPAKAADYFEHARPELLDRIPRAAKRVLDVGCGAGRLGERLKQRQACEVWGIEREPRIADSARRRLDNVICRNAEQINGELPKGDFDCIVCGDVLEHLREPLAFLRQAREWLRENGTIVASLPNVRHHSVLRSLLAGNWMYESAGLLDEDHVRFFTRREIEKLFFRARFEIADTAIVPGPGYAEWARQGRPREVQIRGLSYRARDERDAEDLFAYQYLITATKRSPTYGVADGGLTSIIIVTHNQLPHTRACLDSIRHLTDEPFELICVDNASTDGTPDYLETLAGTTVIRNTENRGFPAAVNQGLSVARGTQILLLNNDTIVTTGWLHRLLNALQRDPSIGLVGPLSNNVSGEQQVPVDYDDLAQLDGFAWDLGQKNLGQTTETDRLVGFCLLMRRDVIDRIGSLDERFGIGNFEDDDFCRRARQAGFCAVIARDAFVHHVGGATFRATGVDFASLMAENHKKYKEKWNGRGADASADSRMRIDAMPQRMVQRHSPFVLDQSDEGPLRLKPAAPRLSLCMIVRDNEKTIRPALESIRPWMDEMIVVDTGSTDRTPDICRQLDARVEHFAWCDDFSAARNESLKYAHGEWVFWMDSDDTIPVECGRKLRALADGEHAEQTLGYVMQVQCPSGNDTDGMTVVDHVKLFRNRPDLRFEHRIHEQILPAIRRAGGEVEFTDIYVVHSGSDRTREGRKRKLERDYRLLQLDLTERPDHPFVLFNLGMTYNDDGRHSEAVETLRRCLQVSQPQESHARKVYALLVGSLAAEDQFGEAHNVCNEGLQLYPDDRELLFRRAMLEHHAGRLEEAAKTYRVLLRENGSRYFASLDPGITGHKARHNLALVYEAMENEQRAEEQWRRITTDEPQYRPGWKGLGDSLLRQKRFAEAESLARDLSLKPAPLSVTGSVLQGKIARQLGRSEEAERLLGQAVREQPQNAEAVDELARLRFEQGDFQRAEPALQRLARLTPEDASVWHNLGSVALATGRAPEAVTSLEKSVSLRPGSTATRQLLADALQRCGRAVEAQRVLQEVKATGRNGAGDGSL